MWLLLGIRIRKGSNLLEHKPLFQLAVYGTVAVQASQTTGVDVTHIAVLFLDCGSYEVVCVYCSVLHDGVVVTS